MSKKKSIIVHILVINRHRYEMIPYCDKNYNGDTYSLQKGHSLNTKESFTEKSE